MHPELLRALQCWEEPGSGACPDQASLPAASDGYLPVIVEWRRELNLAAQVAATSDRLAQRRQVIALLQAEAQLRSGPLQARIAAAQGEGLARRVRAFWASPVIALEGRPELIAELSRRSDVVQVRLDQQFALEDPGFQEVPPPQPATDLPWNLAMLDVAQANYGLGLDGHGVVVANLDTGVDWQHPALLTHYRGYREHGLAVHQGNWHVSTDEPYTYPGDGNGHGTHTMGTMVGDDGQGHRVGVAPGARWIAVKAFNNAGYAYESWLHDAFQWILAPEGDPSLAPDVVNNSWSSDVSSDTRFLPDVEALIAAGILPIFAAGNEGPRPGSVGSPASCPSPWRWAPWMRRPWWPVSQAAAPARGTRRSRTWWRPASTSSRPFRAEAMRRTPARAWPRRTSRAWSPCCCKPSPACRPTRSKTLLRDTAHPLGALTPNDDHRLGAGQCLCCGPARHRQRRTDRPCGAR